MKGELRPSIARALLYRSINTGLVFVSFLVVVFVICGLGSMLIQPKPSTTGPQSDSGAHAARQDLSNSSEQIMHAGNKAYDAAESIVRRGSSEGSKLLNSRPIIQIPPTPFACLVEHLLGRGDQCPSSLGTAEKCLKLLSHSELNRPIGLIYWTYDSGEWEKHTETAYKSDGERPDNGPTYKVLYFADDHPPGNAIPTEESLLSICKPEDVTMLVEAGCDPDMHFGEHGDTALTRAARRGDLLKAKALVGANANKRTRDLSGQTPDLLYDVTASNSQEMRKLLE